jgi:poly-gamma-glutamate synthesis protein (capsule biosynthesis protein)
MVLLAALGGGARNTVSNRPSLPARQPPAVRLVFGGDVMLTRHVGRIARANADAAYPFRLLAPLLSAADIAFVNLESPFSDRGKPTEKGMVFRAHPSSIEGLLLAGIDVVSTANNHSRDGHGYGVEYTYRWLQKHGIAAAGTGLTPEAAHAGVVLERKGVRFGFLAYTYDQSNGNHRDVDARVADMNLLTLVADVAALRNRSDAVIVSMHAGDEYRLKPNLRQQEFARAAIDAGAAVVAGHHPHVVQPFEIYKGGVIFYSLGNLVFDQFQRAETQEGLIAEVLFRGARLEDFRVHAVDIRNAAPVLRKASYPVSTP